MAGLSRPYFSLMKYFLHDTNAFQDEKITELYMHFGYEGIGLFFTCLEKLAMQEKPVKTSVLKKQLNVGKKLEKCWNFMESLGILSSNNGETFNKQLLNFSEKYQIKSEKNRKKVSEWRDKQTDTENVTGYVPVRNPPKVKVSKVKESKVKVNKQSTTKNIKSEEEKTEIKDLIFPFNTPKFLIAWDHWNDYRKANGFPYKNKISEQAALKSISGFNETFAIKLIEKSMGNGWRGLIFEKTEQEYQNSLKSNNNAATNQKGAKPSIAGLSEIANWLANGDH